MTPEYLEELADLADPNKLWKRAFPLDNLTADERRQLDTGVALRRYADHIRGLRIALDLQRSVLITPLSENGNAKDMIETPPKHARLRQARERATRGVAASAPGFALRWNDRFMEVLSAIHGPVDPAVNDSARVAFAQTLSELVRGTAGVATVAPPDVAGERFLKAERLVEALCDATTYPAQNSARASLTAHLREWANAGVKEDDRG